MAVTWKKLAYEDDVILNALLTERGSIIFRNATIPAELKHGNAGQVLTSGGDGADPSWSAAGTGTVTAAGPPNDNEYAKWTSATEIEGRTYANVLADLSGQAGAAFSLNGQQLTEVVIHTVANAAGRPSAAVGKICWQTDTLALYACTIAA
jgi:hypothetical protein